MLKTVKGPSEDLPADSLPEVGLSNLPSELLLHVFSYLSPPQLVKVSLSCKLFLSLSRTENLWHQLSQKRWFLPQHSLNNKEILGSLLHHEKKTKYQLPLVIKFIDAEEDNIYHLKENLLHEGGFCFSTRTEFQNVNIVLSSRDESSNRLLFVKELTLNAPKSNYSAPVNTALAFVLHDVPDIEKSNAYKDLTRKDYIELVSEDPNFIELQRGGLPVAFFQCSTTRNRRSHTITFSPPLVGRYIHLKLLSNDVLSLIPPNNLDVESFIVKGFIYDTERKEILSLLDKDVYSSVSQPWESHPDFDFDFDFDSDSCDEFLHKRRRTSESEK